MNSVMGIFSTLLNVIRNKDGVFDPFTYVALGIMGFSCLVNVTAYGWYKYWYEEDEEKYRRPFDKLQTLHRRDTTLGASNNS